MNRKLLVVIGSVSASVYEPVRLLFASQGADLKVLRVTDEMAQINLGLERQRELLPGYDWRHAEEPEDIVNIERLNLEEACGIEYYDEIELIVADCDHYLREALCSKRCATSDQFRCAQGRLERALHCLVDGDRFWLARLDGSGETLFYTPSGLLLGVPPQYGQNASAG